MKNLISCCITLCLLSLTNSFAQPGQPATRSYISDPLLAPRDHNVDFLNLKLELAFNPSISLVKGKVTHTFMPLRQKIDSIVLDAINITVKEILLNGKSTTYRNDTDKIVVYTPELVWEKKDSMTITYECTPRHGLYFIGWKDKSNISRKQIWSQGQAIDNRNWIPMYDEMNDKIISETYITFDTAYRVLSNGKMVEKKNNKNGTNTWHYKMSHPHASYLIMIGIGIYDVKETKSASGVPLHLLYYPDWKEGAEATYQYSEKMVDFFEKEIGVPYQWESYSQIPVQDFMYGAMENTTATVFGDFFCPDARALIERNYIGVNAHELAHQWFGDFVTARSDAHHWLQESFATYYNQMFEREVFGDNYFDWTRRNAQNSSLDESKKNNLPVCHSEGGSTRHYPKGAFVLNMLKNVLGGREVYNKCIKHYLTQHPYANVDTEDLLVACEEVTGMQLDWFWEEWIYKGGEPSYQINFHEITEGTLNYSEFIVQQIQELTDVTGLSANTGTKINNPVVDPLAKAAASAQPLKSGLWKMPIPFEVHYTDGTVDSKLLWIEKQTEIIRIPTPAGKKVEFTLFDPNNTVLKTVSFEKSFAMLKAQAQKATNFLDRYEAVTAMQKINIEEKRDFLISLFNVQDKAMYYPVKTEIIKQLAQDKNKQSEATIRAAITNQDVKVRRSVIDNFKSLSKEFYPDLEKLLQDSSYEITLLTLDRLSYANPENISKYLEKTKNIEGLPGKNVKIKWLEIAASKDTKYLNQLISYCSNSYEFRTRLNAMTAIKKLNYLNELGVENIIDGALNPNSKLSTTSLELITYFYNQIAYKGMITKYITGKQWNSVENKIVKNILK